MSDTSPYWTPPSLDTSVSATHSIQHTIRQVCRQGVDLVGHVHSVLLDVVPETDTCCGEFTEYYRVVSGTKLAAFVRFIHIGCSALRFLILFFFVSGTCMR